MPIRAYVRSLWGRFFARHRQEHELDDELQSFLQMAADAHHRRGLDAEQARRAARLELGGLEQVKERVRDAWAGAALDALGRDLRYGARALRRQPVLTAAAVLTLALGIGANSAIFSLVHAVLLRPLPYEGSDRLALVWCRFDNAGQARNPASGPELVDLRQRSRLFEDFAGIWSSAGALTGEGDPEQVRVGFTTANFFEILGARPALGRSFLAAEEGEGEGGAMLLSDSVWRRRFGADPGILGQTVHYDGHPVEVVGVMAPDFELRFPTDAGVPADIEVWLPFGWDIAAMPRDLSFIRVLGRLRPQVELLQAREELAAIAEGLRGEFSRYHEVGLGLEPIGLHADVVRQIRPALLALFGAVGLVLLIACLNVANLQLGRFGGRTREIALRAALGAGRGRIARQLLLESLMLALLGGAVALPLGAAFLRLVGALHPPGLEQLSAVTLDPPVLAFTFGLAILTSVVFGLAPVLRASRPAGDGGLARGGGAAPRHGRFRELLIVTELALGFVLLTSAGLLIRSLVLTLEADPGFRATGALTFQVSLPRSRYPGDAERAAMTRQLNERLAALPGVEAVGAVSHLPLDDYSNWYGFTFRDGATDEQKTSVLADQRAATPGYFEAMGAERIAGRLFSEADHADSRRVAVVDQVLAGQLWPDGEAVGQGLHLEAYENGSFVPIRAEVVGVVRQLRHHGLTTELRGQAYLPHSQSARPVLSYVLRTSAEATSFAKPAAAVLHQLDPELPMAKVSPMSDYLRQASAAPRFVSVLGSLFAAIALALGAIGIYGVLSYSVTRRCHEIGVRMALGARAGQILNLVLGRAGRAVLAGLLLGIAGALNFGHLLTGLLYGVTATDLPTYAVVAVILLAVAATAACVPAVRAARIDPSVSLRHE